MSAFSKAVRAARRGGPRELGAQLLAASVYRRLLVFERPVPGRPAEISDPRLTRQLLEADGVDDYLAFRPGSDRADVLSRLEAGHLCFAIRFEDRIVHACWVARGRVPIDYLHCTVALAPDEAYVYDNYTEPGARLLRAARVREAWMARHMYDTGIRRGLFMVLPENEVGRRWIEEGRENRLLGTIGYVGAGRLRRGFTRPRDGGSLPRPEL